MLVPGSQMIDTIRSVIGRHAPARQLPWVVRQVASPAHRLSRETVETRHLWQRPLQLDNRKRAAELGAEPHAPFGQEVQTRLEALGCT